VARCVGVAYQLNAYQCVLSHHSFLCTDSYSVDTCKVFLSCALFSGVEAYY
jgi:hypothetical protein